MSDSDQDKAEKPVKLVHYTTAEAAYSILSKGELWMRKASLMNDFKEASFFIDIMHKLQRHQKEFLHSNKTPKEYKERYKKEIEKDETIQECLKRRGETYGENTFQEILSENEMAISELRHKTYISSFSIESDEEKTFLGRLSMWRSYGSKASIAIVFTGAFYTKLIKVKQSIENFTIESIENFTIACGEVFYPVIPVTPVNLENLLQLSRETTLLDNMVSRMGASASFFVKHRGFQEEDEWRLLIQEIDGKNLELDQNYTLTDNLTLRKSLRIIRDIPQEIFILNFNKEDIDSIIVGPTFDIDHAYAIKNSFARVIHNSSKIHLSSIPLRVYI